MYLHGADLGRKVNPKYRIHQIIKSFLPQFLFTIFKIQLAMAFALNPEFKFPR